jgi:hypothetical protein
MATTERQLRVVLDATEIVLRAIEALPPSAEQETLLEEARDSLRIVEDWAVEVPTLKERAAAMKRVLRLHAAATELGRLRTGR